MVCTSVSFFLFALYFVYNFMMNKSINKTFFTNSDNVRYFWRLVGFKSGSLGYNHVTRMRFPPWLTFYPGTGAWIWLSLFSLSGMEQNIISWRLCAQILTRCTFKRKVNVKLSRYREPPPVFPFNSYRAKSWNLRLPKQLNGLNLTLTLTLTCHDSWVRVGLGTN